MNDPKDLEQRVKGLEAELARLRGGQPRGIRKRASFELFGLPAYDIAVGPDPSKGELRGHAKGFLAIGDLATGVIALGGLARGLVAAGGLALGGLSFGGLSLGLVLAFGGVAIGNVAVGGAAAGRVAVGGAACGYYAAGGAAGGRYVLSPTRHDPEAEAFFAKAGLHPPTRRQGR
ncbi:MAG TPA: hypothetical protein VJ483_02940 [Holophagaceae bacterium]|nr:hypothetical protein [Holophagaceae bacterium]